MESLSLKLNYFKKKFKLTNKKIAELADIPVATVERIASGRTQNPNLKTLKALAKIFECQLDDLIKLEENTFESEFDKSTENIAKLIKNDENLRTLFSAVIMLNENNKQAVIGLAQRLKTLQDKIF